MEWNFELLYLLDHIRCFNKIQDMLNEYSHKNSESLVQLHANFAEI